MISIQSNKDFLKDTHQSAGGLKWTMNNKVSIKVVTMKTLIAFFKLIAEI